jgi:CRISPR-associated protein Csb1
MNDTKVEPKTLTNELLDEWATDPKGPVALHLKQRLLAVEGADGEEQIIYPPTYADIGYNIDRLSDGTRVALIDSVGSQANRLEPAFKTNSALELDGLVPQIDIVLRKEPCMECDECKKAKTPKVDKCKNPWKEKRSLFDLAHRAADAVVQSSPTLLPQVEKAFEELRRTGDASSLCTIAPTSLVFGCWDSRGGSGEKRPRLVRAIIRAWDVDELRSAAQFNSVWKALDEEQREGLKKALPKGKKLSEKGFNDAPAVGLGGIVVRGPIQRDVTINLVALRGLNGGTQTDELRKYLLGLSILAATSDIELFLREGCNLRFADKADQWYSVPRRGENSPIDLVSEQAWKVAKSYAKSAYETFHSAWKKISWPDGSIQPDGTLEVEFDLKAAKELLGKTTDEEAEGQS